MTFPMALVIILTFLTGGVSGAAIALLFLNWIGDQHDFRLEVLKYCYQHWPAEWDEISEEEIRIIFEPKPPDDPSPH